MCSRFIWKCNIKFVIIVAMNNYRPQYLVVGGGASFTRIPYNSFSNPESHATHFDIGRVQAMAYDNMRDTLYLYDGQRKDISYVNMTEFSLGVPRLLIYTGLENVVDMDYDFVSDTLYILDAGRLLVEVVSLKTHSRAVLTRFKMEEVPISFCLLPDYGKMLVAIMEDEDNYEIHIDSIGLDGEGRQHLVTNNIKGDHVSLRYSSYMDNVYIADEGNLVIDYIHPEGSARENYRMLSSTVTNLAIAGHLVFWTNRQSSKLYWADIHEVTQKIRRIELSIFPNNTQLYIQATSPPLDPKSFLMKHPCLTQNPCTDICVQTPHPVSSDAMGYKCLCSSGLLLVDNRCDKQVVCKGNELYCHNSNVCFPKEERCDGVKNCPHGEDEVGCEAISHPPNEVSVLCFPDEILCDGVCMNKQRCLAEHKMSPAPAVPECADTEYNCTGVCEPRSQLCDGKLDCPDGSDESLAFCKTLTCMQYEFMCTSGSCILKNWRCDGDEDCNDGSDEIGCENKTCSQGMYRCRSGECIALNNRCDGQMDCSDFSDEDHCQQNPFRHLFNLFHAVKHRCPVWQYTCEMNKTICLPITARCNGKVECPGGTDESGCEFTCYRRGLYACKQQQHCVTMNKVCDGKNDCADGSDEIPEACARVKRPFHATGSGIAQYSPTECHHGFLCQNGQCLEWRQVCDHKQDCSDGTDENNLCLVACENNACSHSCLPTPKGAQCTCPLGYQLAVDRHTCVDVDECAVSPCAQLCHNLPGSFLCSCRHGYALRFDGHSCKAVKGSMSILYVSGNLVRSISADGHRIIEYNDTSGSEISDIDFDVKTNSLYLVFSEAEKLTELNSTRNATTVTNVGRPTKVAVDWVTGNVYFVDRSSSGSYIRVCHVQKKKCAKLFKLAADTEITALIVDPASKLMFYCARHALESVVWSASLSGRRRRDLATLGNCTGLAADPHGTQLYVAEAAPSSIHQLDYTGIVRKKFVSDDLHLQDPHSLAFFEDHVYFLVGNTFKLNRCLLYGKKICEPYMYRLFGVDTFIIRHNTLQRDDVVDQCQGFECSNLCVLDEAGPLCVCDDGSFAKHGRCPVMKINELPLFNGWSAVEPAGHAVATIVVIVMTLLVLYFSVYFFYRHQRRARKAHSLTYDQVRFQHATEELTYPTTETSNMQGPFQEFVNPLQFFQNAWRKSLRKQTCSKGSEGLTFDIPKIPEDFSDTESDFDVRENRSFLKK